MNQLIIKPESKAHWLEMRHKNINSTEVSILYNANPYQTIFELYHRKRSDDLEVIEENERMRWGTRLQDAIAKGVASDKCWVVEPMNDYISLPDCRLGSSFDYMIGDREAILEIKNVDSLQFQNKWTEDEAPAHIELQVQTQMLVSGIHKCYICALVGGNKIHLIERDYNPKIGESILKKVAAFWAMQDAPAIDYHKDAAFVKELYSFAEPNKTIEPTERLDELAAAYKELQASSKQIEESLEAVKAEMLSIMQDAEKVKGQGYSINAGIVAEAQVSYTRKAYRTFKIFFKKEKANE